MTNPAPNSSPNPNFDEEWLANAVAYISTQPDAVNALTEKIAENPAAEQDLRELAALAEMANDLGSGWFDETAPAIAPSDSAPSPTLDDYEILGELGRGGMGVVYRARQKSLNRIVALKMLRLSELTTPEERARFEAEAEAAAALAYPHIVPIHDIGMVDRDGQAVPFFSMKLIEGETLADRIATGPLPPHQIARLLVPICRAIDYAHSQGVLHRDLKPSNILIDPEGRPYVSDFGLAKRVAGRWGEARETSDRETEAAVLASSPPILSSPSLTQTGAVLGTPAYMSPEQAAGNRGDIGPRSDVYSLGAILYACLAGRPPFQGATPVDILLRVLEQDAPPPRTIHPNCDRDLELIAVKCLQKPADLRYESAGTLADDLERYLASEPLAARSGRFSGIFTRAFRETHHATVLENWGLLWMWHALALLILCVVTNALQLGAADGVISGLSTSRWPYLFLWTVGLGLWAVIFWNLRKRSGPITFVERQIAHTWAGAMAGSTLLYAIEWTLNLPVLSLSPVLALLAGITFLVKAGILTGRFYLQAAVLFATSVVMAAWESWSERTGVPNLSITLFGVVSGLCFLVPGWRYWRR
ncbi:serine/threonine-protein kinase [Stratiformator vulcanicus]|uniref:non-specific serine/threonine protein kinase n=1 Tax=Stratiformator vulcanicus TaxID=2527980 RepID=A0A517R7Y0_9PLAN|nr:serine/threonine-protein kinase [Stratiformator vulcanicus]QDT39931.1 Serine/threonine-protein kinase PknB [Stratiformator vulcanicus]